MPRVVDFALVCLLGLLGLRIFETVGADIDDLGEEHGHGSCGCGARAAKLSWSRCRLPSAAPWTGQPAIARMGRFCSTGEVPGLRPSRASACRGCTRTCLGTPS